MSLTFEEKIARVMRDINGYIAGERDTITRAEKQIKFWEKRRKALENREPDAIARVLAAYPRG